VTEEVSSSSNEQASEGFPLPEVVPPAKATDNDRTRAARELEEARRLYDVAALVHERSGLGSTDSAPIAHKALTVLMRLIVRLHGVVPGEESELIAQTQRVNAKESLVGYDLTEDLTIIAQAKERFFDLGGEVERADNRRYDRAFIRSAKLFGAAQDYLGDLMPETRRSPLRHWKIAAVAVLALGVGFVLGSRGRRPAPPPPAPVVAATPAPPAPAGSASPTAESPPGQVLATFFRDPELKQVALTRADTRIDFNWASEEPPELGQNDHFGVRWAGKLNVTERGNYDFYLTSDDGSRLFIGDDLVVDNWGIHTVETKQANRELEVGVHPFRVEYFDGTGDAVIKLEWSSSTQPRRVASGHDFK
jgi:hypothetical protein